MTLHSAVRMGLYYLGNGIPGFPVRLAALAAALMATSWVLLWTRTDYWNPLYFTGMWLGGTLLIYSAGRGRYPGITRHLSLALLSVPLWWWFELVNGRVNNWEYITAFDYGSVPYALFASLAFSTVAPALDAATRLTIGRLPPRHAPPSRRSRALAGPELAAGAASIVLTVTAPDVFFPLVWIGPFLVLDGMVAIQGGRGILGALAAGEWRLAVAVGLAGLMCGVLWEFWNFWASPKWVYHLPYADFLHVFEMPLLGYLGYIPFAWSVYQLVHVPALSRYLGRADPGGPQGQV